MQETGELRFRLRSGLSDPSPLAVAPGANRLKGLFDSVEVGSVPSYKAEMSGLKPSDRNYVLLLTPRSGSTFIASQLEAEKTLGVPREWFNWQAVTDIVRAGQIADIYSYCDFLRRTRKTGNGVFGVSIAWHQLRFITEMAEMDELLSPGATWFYLRRRDLVAQAVSLQVAVDSGVFHSVNPDTPSPEGMIYTDSKIRAQLEMILYSEVGMEGYLREREIQPIRLSYEDDVVNPRLAIELVRRTIGVAAEDINMPEKPLAKIWTGLKQDWKDRFSDTHSIYLQDVNAVRPPLLHHGEGQSRTRAGVRNDCLPR